MALVSERLFGVDPLAGTKEFFSYDDTDDSFTIRTEQDVTALIEANKVLSNAAEETWRGDMHRVASIPLSLMPMLEKQGIMTKAGAILDEKKLRAWLNDADNRYFRTRGGYV